MVRDYHRHHSPRSPSNSGIRLPPSAVRITGWGAASAVVPSPKRDVEFSLAAWPGPLALPTSRTPLFPSGNGLAIPATLQIVLIGFRLRFRSTTQRTVIWDANRYLVVREGRYPSKSLAMNKVISLGMDRIVVLGEPVE